MEKLKFTGLLAGLSLIAGVLLTGRLVSDGPRVTVVSLLLLAVGIGVLILFWAGRKHAVPGGHRSCRILPLVVCAMIVCNLTAYAAEEVAVNGSLNDNYDVSVYAEADKPAFATVTSSDSKITIVSKGYTDKSGTCSTDYNNNVYVTVANNAGEATIKLQIATSNITSIDANNCTYDSSNNSVTLAPNQYIVFKVTSGKGAGNDITGTVEITGYDIQYPDKEYTTTFETRTGGTFTLDGTALTGTTNRTQLSSVTYQLTAKADSGYVFKGWMSSSGNRLSEENPYTYQAGSNLTIWPVFKKSDSAMYRVRDGYYGYFDDALDAAGPNGTVVVCEGGTMYGSRTTDFTIETTQKVLIPFSQEDIGIFGSYPVSSDYPAVASSTTPSAYLTLTVPNGTTITCKGSINVNGQRSTSGTDAKGTGIPKGKHGLLKLMGSGDQLTITEGGKLYAYGFITGTGKVNIQNGTLHELIQIYDWCGGSNARNWTTASGYNSIGRLTDTTKAATRMFFLGHYYVQNVEAPLRVYAGSTVNVEAVLSATLVTTKEITAAAAFVSTPGSSSLFQLGTGTYLDRTYDPTTDHVTYSLGYSGNAAENQTGEISLGAISIEISEGATVSSSAHTMPISHALTIKIGDKVSVNAANRVALMPGCEIIVQEGGTLNLKNQMYIFGQGDKTVGTNSTSMFWGTEASRAPLYAASRATPTTVMMPAFAALPSANLTVNGTLNVSDYGALYTTTTTATSTDKVIKGTGKIVVNGAPDNVGLYAGVPSPAAVPYVDALANLAGHDGMQSIGSYTYYGTAGADGIAGTADDVWYNYVVNTDSAENLAKFSNITESAQIAGNSITPYGGSKIENVLGLMARNKAGTLGTFGFTLPACTKPNASSSTLTPGDDRAYSLGETISGHVTISLAEEHGGYTSEVTAPTCTTAGYTTHSCACGNDSDVTDRTAPLGHLWGDNGICTRDANHKAAASIDNQFFATVAEALEAAPAGSTIKILAADADQPAFNKRVDVVLNGFTYEVQTAEGWIATPNEDGTVVSVTKASDENLFHITATNVNMGNNLDMLFAIPKNAVPDWSGHYITLVRAGSADAEEDESIRIAYSAAADVESGITGTSEMGNAYSWYASGDFYIITYGGFDAKEMCDTVTLTVHSSDGTAVSHSWTDSIRSYAMRILGSTKDQAQANVVVDMLNFGAAAQLHLNYGVNNLANRFLTAAQKMGNDHDNISTVTPDSTYFKGGNLIVESHIKYNVAFTGQTDGMTAKISYIGHKGEQYKYEQTVPLSDVDGNKCFVVEGLVVADARYPINITVYNADGTEYTTCTDSIEAYIGRMTKDKPDTVYAAFMKFADSAHRFKHSGSAIPEGGTT